MDDCTRTDDPARLDDPTHREPSRARAAHLSGGSSTCPASALGAVDLLALASRAATRVASEQSEAVAAAARTLESVARDQGNIWVAGVGADAHARRFEAAGQRALVCLDLDRLPLRLGPFDALVLCVSGDAPRELLAEARRYHTDTIVLAGPSGIDHDGGVVIRVRCYDRRALELTHGFILTALCGERSAATPAAADRLDSSRSESAA